MPRNTRQCPYHTVNPDGVSLEHQPCNHTDCDQPLNSNKFINTAKVETSLRPSSEPGDWLGWLVVYRRSQSSSSWREMWRLRVHAYNEWETFRKRCVDGSDSTKGIRGYASPHDAFDFTLPAPSSPHVPAPTASSHSPSSPSSSSQPLLRVQALIRQCHGDVRTGGRVLGWQMPLTGARKETTLCFYWPMKPSFKKNAPRVKHAPTLQIATTIQDEIKAELTWDEFKQRKKKHISYLEKEAEVEESLHHDAPYTYTPRKRASHSTPSSSSSSSSSSVSHHSHHHVGGPRSGLAAAFLSKYDDEYVPGERFSSSSYSGSHHKGIKRKHHLEKEEDTDNESIYEQDEEIHEQKQAQQQQEVDQQEDNEEQPGSTTTTEEYFDELPPVLEEEQVTPESEVDDDQARIPPLEEPSASSSFSTSSTSSATASSSTTNMEQLRSSNSFENLFRSDFAIKQEDSDIESDDDDTNETDDIDDHIQTHPTHGYTHDGYMTHEVPQTPSLSGLSLSCSSSSSSSSSSTCTPSSSSSSLSSSSSISLPAYSWTNVLVKKEEDNGPSHKKFKVANPNLDNDVFSYLTYDWPQNTMTMMNSSSSSSPSNSMHQLSSSTMKESENALLLSLDSLPNGDLEVDPFGERSSSSSNNSYDKMKGSWSHTNEESSVSWYDFDDYSSSSAASSAYVKSLELPQPTLLPLHHHHHHHHHQMQVPLMERQSSFGKISMSSLSRQASIDSWMNGLRS